MEITIPRWAKDVKDENWLVLFWFTRNLTVCYPPYAEAAKTVPPSPQEAKPSTSNFTANEQGFTNPKP